MAESSSSSSFQAISTSNNNNIQPPLYDVFVSFRGEDVRKGFVSHLQAAFKRKGIATFFDEELKRGQEISPDLLKAIQQSSIYIVVFSENYASSTWCLNELLEIFECRNTVEKMIIPVFYGVDPSNVRKQTGSYAEAFTRHEETPKHGKDVIQKWRDALTEIANLSGFDSANWRKESDMVDKITQEILKKLDRLTSDDVDGLIGIRGRVDRILEKLFADGAEDDVRILGIWGMGGIGKTTVATTLFHEIKNNFDGYYFLENVRENSGENGHGLPGLQKKLFSEVTQDDQLMQMNISSGGFLRNRLCGKKVLIVLDDIDHMDQLEKLAGGRNWFGVGSRIVITTRNRQLLTDADVIYDYAKEQLSDEEALHLFSHHAFKTSHPPKVYLEFSIKAINYACGIPLALKLLGSYLRNKDIKTWESALDRLERISDNKIVKRILELSFEGLESNQKKILLDVACCLKGDDVEFATSLWDVCGFYPPDSISVLCDNCLMSVDSGQLWMHDLIQEMCKAKVRKESTEPGERSRLWEPKDIFHVFNNNTGTSKIECIILNLSETNEVLELREEAFVKMEKLRFLKFFSRKLNEIRTKIRVPRGLGMLPGSLINLCWDRYPNKFLASKFDAQNLVGLSLRQSCIKQLLKGHWIFRHSSICLKRLKRLDLSGCSEFSNLSTMFDNMEHLNKLILKGTGVSNLPSSIENLTGLVKLNLSNCKNLASLPDSICNLKRLVRLDVSGCKSLQHLPEKIGDLESLWYLLAAETSIKHAPASIENLTELFKLNLSNCKNLASLPDSICNLKRLKVLVVSGCKSLQHLPENIGNLESLWDLLADGTSIKHVPASIENLTELFKLNLSNCKNLASLPDNICNLKRLRYLDVFGRKSLQHLPENFGNLESLRDLLADGTSIKHAASIENLIELNLSNCKNLASLPDSICNLKRLDLLDVSGCKSLQHLPENIGNLESLRDLLADGTSIEHVPASINCLKNIRMLSFRGCRGTKPSTSYWLLPRSSIYTTSCMGLQLPAFEGCQNLLYLNLSNCNLLEAPRGLHNLSSLSDLDLSGNNFETLPQTIFYNLSSLRYLKLNHCTRLRSLPELPPSLTTLNAVECTSLESFMSSLNLFRGIGERIETGLSFSNCFKLKNQCNYILKSMVKDFHLAEKAAQNLYDQDYCCDHGLRLRLGVTMPGSEIPEWFNDQAVGNTRTFALPPHCLDNSLGLAFCVIISPNHTNFESSSHFFLDLTLRDNDKKAYKNYLETSLQVRECSFKDDHLVFAITSLCGHHWPNDSWLYNSNHIECSVELVTVHSSSRLADSDRFTVKNCAVRLVNVEEKTQTSFNASSQYLHNHSTHDCIVTDNPERRTVVGCRQCEKALKTLKCEKALKTLKDVCEKALKTLECEKALKTLKDVYDDDDFDDDDSDDDDSDEYQR